MLNQFLLGWLDWRFQLLCLVLTLASFVIPRAEWLHLFRPSDACPWRYTFGDEFNGKQLDRSKWQTAYGSGGNGEQQYYAPEAFHIGNGLLKIRATATSQFGYEYTSGIIQTQTSFGQQYGNFQMRARLPRGQGLWPGFWLLPVSKSYPWEIDVFELLGHEPQTIYLTHHWRDAEGEHRKQQITYSGPDFSEEFHTFEVIWNAHEIVWYVDKVEQFRTSRGVPQEPMFILANLAVGGSWSGSPDESTPFPSDYEIDYIRVYQQQCGEVNQQPR